MEKLPQPITTAIVFNKPDQTTTLAAADSKAYVTIAEKVTDLSQKDSEQAQRFCETWNAAHLRRGADVLHNALVTRGNTIVAEQKVGTFTELGTPYQEIQQQPGYYGIASDSTEVVVPEVQMLSTTQTSALAQTTQTLVSSSGAVQVWEAVPATQNVIRIIAWSTQPEQPAAQLDSPFDPETQNLFSSTDLQKAA